MSAADELLELADALALAAAERDVPTMPESAKVVGAFHRSRKLLKTLSFEDLDTSHIRRTKVAAAKLFNLKVHGKTRCYCKHIGCLML